MAALTNIGHSQSVRTHRCQLSTELSQLFESESLTTSFAIELGSLKEFIHTVGDTLERLSRHLPPLCEECAHNASENRGISYIN